ncbi:MAG: ParA family protein [Planctomycetes bacterium]|nr:ParA family protein [Planctomycetota bacterium]
MARYIAVANQKGGVGKTTTAVNLCASIALTRRTCLLIDLDPQGNATTGLGIEKKPHNGAYLLLSNPHRATDAIVHTQCKGLDIVPSGPRLADAQPKHAVTADNVLRLKASKPELTTLYDYVIVDCPPSVGFFPANALSCCDSVLVPIQCEYYAMEGLAQILSRIRSAKSNFNPHLEVEGILLTMYEPSAFSNEVAEEVRAHFDDLVYETAIPRNVALAEAPSHGQAIFDYDHRSRGARAYLELAKEVLKDG